MNEVPRIALFADTFHETNGAANVLRRLTDFAKNRNYPFLCIRAGKQNREWNEGSLKILELKRGFLSFNLDTELKFDPFLWCQKKLVNRALEDFKPDVLHLTGFNDISLLGFYTAHFKRFPAVASWHTNGHEYAARRLLGKLKWLPSATQRKLKNLIEKIVLKGSMKIFFIAQVQLAPNEELVNQIRGLTKRPSFLMSRGVDTNFLSPEKRQRTDDDFVIGYVGRLQAEKNVRFLAVIDEKLQKSGKTNYRFLIVGDGKEENWLRKSLKNAEFTGVLRDEQLARTFADMDLFVFPSKTDAFGNVVLEAMAAGVPGVVMPDGGPKFLIEDQVSGFIANDEQDFCEVVEKAITDQESIKQMKAASRKAALSYSWETVFEEVFKNYRFVTTLKKNVRVDENNTIIVPQ